MDKYALFSVTNKEGIVELGKHVSKTHKILASGGTADTLQNGGVNVIEVSEYTKSPEMFGGRVKTLHPRIHGGILFKNTEEDRSDAQSNDIGQIDLVVCNLYEFQKTIKDDPEISMAIEKIDIGGPTLIRAAAKNFDRVLVVTDPIDYHEIIEQFPDISKSLRLKFASKAFDLVSHYDIAISNYLSNEINQSEKNLPQSYFMAGKKVSQLKYGENSHQQAAYYKSGDSKFYNNLSDNPVSYNNLLDLNAGWFLVKEFEEPACAIIKHRSPCGAAKAKTLKKAYIDALATDKLSAYGGVYVFNKSIDKDTANELVKMFVDVLFATGYDDGVLEILKNKSKMKILEKQGDPEIQYDVNPVPGGFVVQDKDYNSLTDGQLEVVSDAKLDENTMNELKFAFTVVKHARSNAIVIAKDSRALGIGSGQTSRVDATDSAIKRAGEEVKGAVLAGDAFFPFADSIEKAAEVGIKAVISPKGSIRDQEVIDAANEAGIILVFTKVRSFKH